MDPKEDASLISEYSQKISNLNAKKTEMENAKSKAEKNADDAKQAIEKLKSEKEDLTEEKNNLLTTLAEKYPTDKDAAVELQSKIQEYQQNIADIQSKADSDISTINDNIQTLKNEKTELIQNEKTQKILQENSIKADSTPIEFTDDINNVDWTKYGYDKEAGEKLGSTALRVGSSMSSQHNCLGGVKRSFIEATGSSPFGNPGQGITAAADCLDTMRNNENFREIKGLGVNDLNKLPAGAVIVWSRSTSGSSAACLYGHISISVGDGRESSDHICNQYTRVGQNGTPVVFIPIA